jgi:hypothetical protein
MFTNIERSLFWSPVHRRLVSFVLDQALEVPLLMIEHVALSLSVGPNESP